MSILVDKSVCRVAGVVNLIVGIEWDNHWICLSRVRSSDIEIVDQVLPVGVCVLGIQFIQDDDKLSAESLQFIESLKASFEKLYQRSNYLVNILSQSQNMMFVSDSLTKLAPIQYIVVSFHNN